jgi:hypothetical protein
MEVLSVLQVRCNLLGCSKLKSEDILTMLIHMLMLIWHRRHDSLYVVVLGRFVLFILGINLFVLFLPAKSAPCC